MLGLGGVLWSHARGDTSIFRHPSAFDLPTTAGIALALGLGGLLAAATIVSTRLLVQRARWARTLHSEFRELLGPMTRGEIAVFAVSSGVAEEMFFRGAMQPSLGIALTSILFGLIHVPRRRELWPWSAWAGVMGALFGLIVLATGELIGAIAAHIAINYANLHYIRRVDAASLTTRQGRSSETLSS
ncbi:MAG: CPBP family intramembrane glutamic endopeptidase [Polyangiales bacterium]